MPRKAATAEGQLLLHGWQPPAELRDVISRRETFHSMLAALRSRGHADLGLIQAAVAGSDRDAAVTAAVSHALGLFLDSQCLRDGSDLHVISAGLEEALVSAVYGAPGAVLASLEGIETPGALYVRSLAEQAVTPSMAMHSISGRPAARRPDRVSTLRTLVPR